MFRSFQLSLDRLAIIITVATTLLFVLLLLFILIPAISESRPAGILGFIILLGTYSLAILYRPVRYGVTNDWLFIQRPIGKFRIGLNAIRDVRHVSEYEMKFTIRTFGIGGLFGYVGFFANDSIGTMRMFASRRNRTILLNLDNNQNIVLTLDDPEGMIQYFKTLGVPGTG